MNESFKLRRGCGTRPRPRTSAPEVQVVYRRGLPLFSTPALPRSRASMGGNVLDSHPELTSHSIDSIFSSSVARFLADARREAESSTQTSLKINLHKLEYPEGLVLYDYRVKVEPEIMTLDKDVRLVLFLLFEKTVELSPFLRFVVHDGAQRLISSRLLPLNFVATVPYYRDEESLEPQVTRKEYRFLLVNPRELRMADLSSHLNSDNSDYNSQPILSALNLILTSYAAHTGVRAGRRGTYYYHPSSLPVPESSASLSANLQAWRGFSLTVTTGNRALLVRIRSGTSPFYTPFMSLSDSLLAYMSQSQDRTHALALYSGKTVMTSYLGYTRCSRIKEFGSASARRTTIYLEDLAQACTVEQYFSLKYGITLVHADDLPVVNIGSEGKNLFVPAEVCRVAPGQQFTGPFPSRINTPLQGTTLAPRIPADKVDTAAIRMLRLSDGGQAEENFGLTISSEMTDINARILPTPRLMYQSSCRLAGRGYWSIQDMRFLVPARLSNAAIVVFENNIDVGTEFQLRLVIMNFLAKCRSFGIQIDTTLPSLHVLSLPERVPERSLLSITREKLAPISGVRNFLLIALPRRESNVYAVIKSICDRELGISNLCVSLPKLTSSTGRERLLACIAMKMNAMLGGTNHSLHPHSTRWIKNAILVGIAVLDLTDGTDYTASIAAVVGSCGKDFVHYPASLAVQESHQGMVADIKPMIVERLEEYRRRMNELPKRVIVFRKGVPDNQIKQLLEFEGSAIRSAFNEYKEYKPKLSLIICNRGRRIQFHPGGHGRENATNRVVAGTTIDQGVTGQRDHCFYLQTHTASQSPTRATRYAVVLNENKWSTSEFQRGINDLNYLCPLAPRTISIAAPAYMASLACKRGRTYVQDMVEQIKLNEAGTDGGRMVERVKQMWGTGVHANVKRTMFYL